MVARVLRWTSIAVSLVLVASFAMFALDQARSASADSQNTIAGNPQADQAGNYVAADAHHTTVRKAFDGAANALELPFKSLGVRSSHQWVVHGALLAIGLLLYGVGLGYLSRWVGSTRPAGRVGGGRDPGTPSQVLAG